VQDSLLNLWVAEEVSSFHDELRSELEGLVPSFEAARAQWLAVAELVELEEYDQKHCFH
jgi:hypothetical protein